MEFRKVGEELHIIKNDIPLYIFGEGYIKRYCIDFGYRNYKLSNNTFISGLCSTMLVNKDPKLFLSLREFYGEERGEFVYNLILRSIFKIIKVPHSFLFPEGKEFVTTTSDYLPKDDIDEDIEVIEEEILAKTDDKSYTILNKVPVAYSIYKLEKTYLCDPVLSNDTQDVYLIGDKVEVRIKSFPISNVFKYCNVEKEFRKVCWNTKKDLIQFMNECSLEEQFHTLVGDSKMLTKLQKNIKVPSNTIVTRWSKYLILPYTLRKLLIKNKKQIGRAHV